MCKVSRMVAVGAAVGALVATTGLLGGAAWSHDPPGTANDPKLVKHTVAAGSEVGYKSAQNAPGSPKANALRFKTPDEQGYAQVEARNVGILGDAIGDVTRLSLKARHTGAPYLDMWLTGGVQLTFKTGGNCDGGVDYGNGWFKYNFSTSPSCQILAADRGGDWVYDNWADAVDGEGAGSTIKAIRVIQGQAGAGTGWVDDIRLGAVMFAGPNVNTHSH